MAERRMFAKTIVLSDAFLDMPLSARCLYFTLGMLADDDGFVNSPKSIMRQAGASTDDLNLLMAKRFILAFDSGVVVIKHWRIHNLIQKDRYKETKYLEEKGELYIDAKGAYTTSYGALPDEAKVRKPLTEAQQKRLDAKKESSLPYSFEYKMRQAFHGERCPICQCVMDGSNNLTKPTIQHNVPISLGGQHEIDNISIICSGCNSSIQNRQETPPYNTKLVKAVWERIGNGLGMDTQVRLGEDRLEQDSVVEDSIDGVAVTGKPTRSKRFVPPTVEEVREYCFERGNSVDPQRFVDYYSSNGWMVGKTKMKDWKAAVRTWEQREKDRPTKPAKSSNPFLDMLEEGDYE